MAVAQGYTAKTVTAKQMIHKGPFVRGYKDAKAMKPFDYDAYTTAHEMELYERGRHFAAVFSGDLKDGKRVLWSAQSALYQAFSTGCLV